MSTKRDQLPSCSTENPDKRRKTSEPYGNILGKWEQLPGELKLTGVTTGNAGVWGVNEHGEIYKQNGRDWTRITGGVSTLKQISSGKSVWGVNGDGNIYTYTCNTEDLEDKYWEQISCRPSMTNVAVSNKDRVWSVSKRGYIYKWNRQYDYFEQHCDQLEGKAKQVSVGESGVWVVNNEDNIFYRTGTFGDVDTDGSGWKHVPGELLKWISSGQKIVVGVNKDDKIFYRRGVTSENPIGSEWVNVPGRLMQIDVDGYQAIGVNSVHNLLKCPVLSELTTIQLTTIAQYQARGKQIKEKYCVAKDKSPVMLPPAPKQTYISVYLDEEGGSSSKVEKEDKRKVEDDKRRQANYEAEVEIYRSLESLKDDILVLHGFKYNPNQYQLCTNSNAEVEGECDFIVIGRYYIVIIEVKDPDIHRETARNKRIQTALKGARKQLDRTTKLIDGVLEQVFKGTRTEQHSMPNILRFSAFPSIKLQLFQNMMDEKQILCKEDFLDFGGWWQENVTGTLSSGVPDTFELTKFEEVKEILLALWCTNKNQCDELKCSLGQCIMDIDKELRGGKITYPSKNRPPNPNVKPVTEIEAANINKNVNIFRDILKVNNLSAEQHNAFSSVQNTLLINGPAGSGKTIVLLAKIIQLIKSNKQTRAVLFTYTGYEDSKSNIKRYQDPLQEAGISSKVLVAGYGTDPDTLVQEILDSTSSEQSEQVLIVETQEQYVYTTLRLLDKLIESNTHLHVFVDDYQVVVQYHYLPEGTYKLLQRICTEFTTTNQVWITCDLTQMSALSRRNKILVESAIIRDIPTTNRVTLSLNLRNTCDIAGILSKIREHIVLHSDVAETADVDIVLPVLRPGHVIHGPRTVVHVIDMKVERDIESPTIANILNTELDKLCKPGVPCGFDIGIVYSTIKNTVESRVPDNKIEVCDVDNCYSAEYPAVIVVYDVYNEYDIASLYLMISRARVYCAVILYTTRLSTLSESQSVTDLLNKLKDSDYVRIIPYD